ncbi:MAG: aminotransferase class I/II-fold pyridoxal phosphate-dependent enzyme [Myxococcota bacterium]
MLAARVSGLSPSIIREMFARRRETSIDLSLGEPALPPEPEVLAAAEAALKTGPQGYTMNAGLAELRTAIAQHHRLPGRDRDSNVIVTVGSEEAVFLTMTALLDPGDEVLIPEPGYPAYRGIARILGAEARTYAVRRETGLIARAEAIEAALTPKTKLLVLNSPSNPFGMVDDAAELDKIAALVEARGLWVLSDEIYADLWYGQAPPPTIAPRTDRAILVNGLSKSCAMTGFRLGYVVAPTSFVPKAILAHQLMVTCAPRVSQAMALRVFSEPALLRRHVPYYQRARAAIASVQHHLPEGARLYLGEGAFYAILDVSPWAKGDPLALAIALLEAEDVVAVPGVAFGPSGDWFFRLSYAAGGEAISTGIERIGRFLKSR